MKEVAVLQEIEKNGSITGENNGGFLFEYQRAVLLALKETNCLTQMQYQYAEQKLKEQGCTFAKSGFAVKTEAEVENDKSSRLLPCFHR